MSGVLEYLKNVNLDDLESELKEKEDEFEKVSQTYRAQITALKTSIKLVSAAQGQSTEKKPKKPKTPRSENSTRNDTYEPTYGDKAVTYLEVAGEATPNAIAKGINMLAPSAIYTLLTRDGRFEKTTKGTYKLAGR